MGNELATINPRWLMGLFHYLMGRDTPVEDVVRFAATVGRETEEAAMTTADQLIAQGETRAGQLMVRMLTSKFGDLDADVRYRVEHATTEQIAVWSHRLVQGRVGRRSSARKSACWLSRTYLDRVRTLLTRLGGDVVGDLHRSLDSARSRPGVAGGIR